MKLRSHITASPRRRWRHHSRADRGLHYRGRAQVGERAATWLWEMDGDDGRSYLIELSAVDVDRLSNELRRIKSLPYWQEDLFVAAVEADSGDA